MKRSPQLSRLSHDHYEGLRVAARLKKGIAGSEDAGELGALAAQFWDAHLAAHFHLEEVALLPVLEEIAASDLARRLQSEHRQIEAQAGTLRTAPTDEAVRAFADALGAHIRFEERELFPYVEQHVVPATLDRVAQMLQDAPSAG